MRPALYAKINPKLNCRYLETSAKGSIWLKVQAGEFFNRRHIGHISKI